jgi:hypothetical protein
MNMSNKRLYDKEGNSYDVKENVGLFGRKKYQVTEANGNTTNGIGNVILALLILAILTLPAGNLSLIIYLLLSTIFLKNYKKQNLQNIKENLAWISIGASIILVVFVYYNYSEKLSAKWVIITCISGAIAYYLLYHIVLWNQRSIEKNKKIKRDFILYSLAAILFIFWNQINNHKNAELNKNRNEYINSEQGKREIENAVKNAMGLSDSVYQKINQSH